MNNNKEKNIILENVRKSYKINNINYDILIIDKLEIIENSFTAITGESGTGKSTLLQIIAGLSKPTEGKILFKNLSINKKSFIDITTLNNKDINSIRREDFGFIYQNHFLLKDLNILNNLLIAKNDKEKAFYLLEKVGMIDKKNRFYNELSGGEKQRISICRALMNNPSFVFADEPTGALDENNTVKIWDLFLSLKKEYNFNLLLVTHDKNLTSLCDSHYKISNKKIIIEK